MSGVNLSTNFSYLSLHLRTLWCKICVLLDIRMYLEARNVQANIVRAYCAYKWKVIYFQVLPTMIFGAQIVMTIILAVFCLFNLLLYHFFSICGLDTSSPFSDLFFIQVEEARTKVSEKSAEMYNAVLDSHERFKDLDTMSKDVMKELQSLNKEKEALEIQQAEAIKKQATLELDAKDLEERMSGNMQAKVLLSYRIPSLIRFVLRGKC